MLTEGIDVFLEFIVHTLQEQAGKMATSSGTLLMSKSFPVEYGRTSSCCKDCSKKNLFHYPAEKKKEKKYICSSLLLMKYSYESVCLSRLRSRNMNMMSLCSWIQAVLHTGLTTM